MDQGQRHHRVSDHNLDHARNDLSDGPAEPACAHVRNGIKASYGLQSRVRRSESRRRAPFHIDIKNLGNIPEGGGHMCAGYTAAWRVQV